MQVTGIKDKVSSFFFLSWCDYVRNVFSPFHYFIKHVHHELLRYAFITPKKSKQQNETFPNSSR